MDVREKDFKSESMIIVLFNDKIKYNKIKKKKKNHFEVGKATKQKEKCPKEGTNQRPAYSHS